MCASEMNTLLYHHFVCQQIGELELAIERITSSLCGAHTTNTNNTVQSNSSTSSHHGILQRNIIGMYTQHLVLLETDKHSLKTLKQQQLDNTTTLFVGSKPLPILD